MTIDSVSAIVHIMKRIHFVYSDQGSFDHFLDSLSDKDVAKLLRIKGWVQEMGILAIQMKWVKKLEDNLYELRSQQGNDIR